VVLIVPFHIHFVDKLKQMLGMEVLIYANENYVSTLYGSPEKDNEIYQRIESEKTNLIRSLQSFDNEEIEKYSLDDKKYYIKKIPISTYYKSNRYNISYLGNIILLKDMEQFVTEKQNFIVHSIIFLVIQILIAGGLSYFMTNIIVRPIIELEDYTKKIGSANFEFTLDKSLVKRSDEIGSFSKSFNKMKDEINENHKQIKYYNNKLEKSYKETKNYLYILEIKNKELEERLKERSLIKDILTKGISEIEDVTKFIIFLLKKLNGYKPFRRAEIIYKNGIDESYEKITYIPENEKIIETSYNENLKYLMTERPIIKDEYIEMPIRTRSGLIGNIRLEAAEMDRNTERIIDIIVSELQIILENTEFYYKLNKRVMDLSFLNSILVSISSAKNIDEMKKMVRDAVAILFNIEYSVLYIYEDEYLMKFKEENEILIKEKHKKIKNIKTYLLNKYTTIKVDKDYYIPLAVKDNLVGVIEIASSERVNTTDKNIAKVFLVQLSIIIKNKIIEFETRKKSFNIIRSLSEAIEAKDIYTRGHSERVMKYGIKIAEKMNLDNEYIEKIKYAGILHDVGKIGIPESILQKNGGLTPDEYAIIKTHPEKGSKILSHMSSLKDINEIVKYHHERIDGTGYPEGLQGEKIPLGARILALADTFDAMTSDRPYRKGLPLEIVKAEIINNKNKQFDAKIVDILIEMLEKKEIEVEK